jgi:hypothetical protein
MQTFVGRTIGSAAGILFAIFWIIGANRERWATRTADSAHPYGIRFKGGTDLFFGQRLGWFMDHALWIFFALLLASVGAEWFGRRRRPSLKM